MIDLASIRNASFTLTPTGYNPEEVDQFLADLADQLSALPEPAAAEPVVTHIEVEQPLAELEPVLETEPVVRADADLDGLKTAVDRTIAAMDAFVQNELAEVKAASSLEVDEIHQERQRMLDEAAVEARGHLDEARAAGEQIVAGARDDGDRIRRSAEDDMQAERERFEQALADRDAQAQGRAAEILAEAEERKREAEALVADANRVQAQVIGAIEQARSTLALPATPAFAPHTAAPVEPEAVESEVVDETEQHEEEPSIDVFGFSREQQGSSLRDMIGDVQEDEQPEAEQAEASTDEVAEQDDAADAA